jgi:lipase chaperone LimK
MQSKFFALALVLIVVCTAGLLYLGGLETQKLFGNINSDVKSLVGEEQAATSSAGLLFDSYQGGGPVFSGGNTFELDDKGHFVADDRSLRLFNFFFTMQGKEDESQIIAHIESIISDELAEPARQEALVFFQQYLAYRKAAAKLVQQNIDMLLSEEGLQQLQSMRRALFGVQRAQSLFAADEQAVRDYFNSRDFKALSGSDRKAALLEIKSRLPLMDQLLLEQRLLAQSPQGK